MLDEHGFSFEVAEESRLARRPVIAILPHPLHGRLVEEIILVVEKYLCFEGRWYSLNWRDHNLAYYQPVIY